MIIWVPNLTVDISEVTDLLTFLSSSTKIVYIILNAVEPST